MKHDGRIELCQQCCNNTIACSVTDGLCNSQRKQITQVFHVNMCLSLESARRVLSPFRGGGIACLIDPDSYAGWSFYTPVRATQARQVEG